MLSRIYSISLIHRKRSPFPQGKAMLSSISSADSFPKGEGYALSSISSADSFPQRGRLCSRINQLHRQFPQREGYVFFSKPFRKGSLKEGYILSFSQAFPRGKVDFAKQKTDEGNLCIIVSFSFLITQTVILQQYLQAFPVR